MSAIGTVEPFEEGKDWCAYEERVALYMSANRIKDESQKKAVFLTLIGRQCYATLRNLCSPGKPSDLSYEELVKLLKDHFQPKKPVIAERFRFYKRVQKDGESAAQFLATLRSLAETCDFGTFLEDALCDCFVCGLREPQVQKRLLTVSTLTLEKAKEIAQAAEIAEAEANSWRAKPEVNLVGKAASPRRPCMRCGSRQHLSAECQHRNTKCHACGKLGHLKAVCLSSQKTCAGGAPSSQQSGLKFSGHKNRKSIRAVHPDESEEHRGGESDDSAKVTWISQVCSGKERHLSAQLHINGRPLRMQVDTGACASLVSKQHWKQLGRPRLQNAEVQLRTWTGESIPVLGSANVEVQYGTQTCELPLIVTSLEKASPLMGRDWLRNIRLNWKEIFAISDPVPPEISATPTAPPELDGLLQKFADVFEPGLGNFTQHSVKLRLQEDALPKFCKARPVPYALKSKIDAELQRMQEVGVIEPVRHSDWATPVVPVSKPNGTIRLCGDYKVTLNPQLKIDHYPMPTPEELYDAVGGGKIFSKLDLSECYLQFPLDEASQDLTTINTHKGLFKFKRLPYGVSSAPALCQQIMESVLQGASSTCCRIDDILVAGKNSEDHLSNLREVLNRLRKAGLRLKLEKCRFFESGVEYLGSLISSEGVRKSPKKVEAIRASPKPTTVSELRSFLGLANYYAKHVANFSTKAAPLYKLLRKDTAWEWTASQQSAWEALKEALASDTVLTGYNPDWPLILAADASSVGIGAVISHVVPDGTEKPIAFASRSLNAAEKNYAQIEKEALAIIFGMKKFHNYTYGQKITIITDHQPLTSIFGPKNGVSATAAARLQRWALTLAAYDYDIRYKNTKQHGNADFLSRLPLATQLEADDSRGVFWTDEEGQGSEDWPLLAKDIASASQRDTDLQEVLRYTRDGWPHAWRGSQEPYLTAT
ncbi:hypothetical protein BOX15_Mlig028849g1 [Macrostomum lignano]|uniref:RNA-directed DNA polymerase n=1 Tax=Macrostomum lignano TaxID=282301 RepID=A0A267GH18_9PLAT|nr:hypothetical protein BOX15_Mlig028849g1 [Macrostomum lignano]